MYQQALDQRKNKREQKAEFKKDKEKKILADVEKMGQEIQRMATYKIRKGKGIERKRKKEDRNPRVKLKNKYARALKKRRARGVVEYDSGPKGRYQGEETGIRSTFVRGDKFGS